MEKKVQTRLFGRFACWIALLTSCGFAAAQGSPQWAEGANYFRVPSTRATSTPGKIEVLEVFSYACPACNQFQPTLNKLKAALPPEAKMAFLPAGFNPAEDWPVFQRAFLTAQILGIAEKSHDAMYDAVWGSGSLAIVDKGTRRLVPRAKQPTLEDLAKFYARYGVSEAKFLETAKSFTVESLLKRCDAQITEDEVDSTPTLIVGGKYRLTPQSAGGYAQVIPLVLYLVAKEKGG